MFKKKYLLRDFKKHYTSINKKKESVKREIRKI